MIKHVAVCAECDKEVPATVLPNVIAHPHDWLKLEAQEVTLWFCTYTCLVKNAKRGRNFEQVKP